MTVGNLPEVVSREEWLAARNELLAKEKELTRTRDRVNADRRRLPMVHIDTPYAFEGPDWSVGLLDLFEGRPQLVMHHFMWVSPQTGRPGHAQPAAPQPLTGSAGCGSCTYATPRSSRCPGRRTRRLPPSGSGWAGRSRGTPRTAATSTTTSTRPSMIGSCRCCFITAARPNSPRSAPRGPADRGRRACAARRCPASARSCGSARRSSTPTPRTAAASKNSTTATSTSTSRPSVARRLGRNRGGVRSLGLQVGGPALRLPDEYDI